MTMAWVAALFVVTVLSVALYDHFVQRPKRLSEAKEREAKRELQARMRGWKFEAERTANSLRHRYSGRTGGVDWTFETYSRTSHSRIGGTNTTVVSRWTSGDVTLPNAILAIWPSFGQPDKIGPQVPQFVMNLVLTPLIAALDATSDEARLLAEARQVPVQNAELTANYLLRASDPSTMYRFLQAGARDALAAQVSWLPSRAHENHLVIAAVWRGGVSIVLKGWVDSIDTLDKLVATGAALTNAWRGV
jgi:hypothetical protein